LHSRVRNLVFGPQALFEKTLGYVVAAFEACGYRLRDDDVYVMYAQPGRMIGRFSLRDDRTLFLFVFATDGRPPPSGLEQQKDSLRAHYAAGEWEAPQILEALNHTQELYFDSVSQIRMDRWSKGRVALVGDAAFCVSLLAGQGSALAMTSAYVLAGELANADGGHEEAFAKYEALLHPYIAIKQQGAERFAAAFAPKTRWGLWFRNQVIRTFALPGLANFAVGREIVDRLELPGYRWRSAEPAIVAPCIADARRLE
jgi:2-polyprenyl-6-methoxyphenol hydroxylase-like FAD-dependent oxidoreductase